MSSTLTHLIIVCCHATFAGGEGGDPGDEANWILQPFQKSNPSTGKLGEHETFLAHLGVSARLAINDVKALLIFSGGKTQTQIQTTESESYVHAWAWLYGDIVWSPEHAVIKKPIAETLATDSYQNLLFSILRFRSSTGSYPRSITVITHAFKERRFLEFHAKAIKWPADRIRVLGINPPFTHEELVKTQEGELKRGHGLFARDLYGVRSPLADKREARNWDDRFLDWVAQGREKEVQALLRWQGGATGLEIFPERLPWEE